MTKMQNVFAIFEENFDVLKEDIPLLDPHAGDSCYSELRTFTNDVTKGLESFDINRRDLIGLFIPNGVTRIAFILALSKLGIPFVPLDPTLPREKMEYIVQQTNLQMVVYDDSVYKYEKIWKDHGIDIPTFSTKHFLQNNEIVSNKDDYQNIQSNDMFCVLPTSGSTGNSKFVRISHENMYNRLTWYWDEFPIDSDDVFVSKTNFLFVDFLTETLSAILKQMPCVFLQRDDVMNIPNLMSHLERYSVTRLVVVPSLLQAMIGEGNRTSYQLSLKMITCSGAMLLMKLVKEFFEIYPSVIITNFYGCTEVTGDVLFKVFHSSDYDNYAEFDLEVAPVGNPVKNTSIILIDDHGNKITETNTVGELWITGANVCEYLPTIGGSPLGFSKMSDGSNVFKSGDRGYLSDKHGYVLNGRSDDMVKIKGHKVRLSEIEHAIRKVVDDVNDLCVMSKYNQCLSTQQCFAFCSFSNVVLNADQQSSRDILSSLKDVLPYYMLPRIIILHDMPLQPTNGKVDRQKLMRMIDSMVYCDDETVDEELQALPRLDRIRIILSSILRVPFTKSDMDATFFELSGDSLTLIAFYKKLNENDIHVSIGQILKSDSLKALSMEDRDVDFGHIKDDKKDAFDLDVPKGFEMIPYSELTEDDIRTLGNEFYESFCENEPLAHYMVNQLHHDLHGFFNRLVQFAFHIYPKYSIVAKLDGVIVGSLINFPYNAELPVFEEDDRVDVLLEFCSREALSLLQVDVSKVFLSHTLYVQSNICNKTKSHVAMLLNKKCADIAKKHGYNLVMTIDTNIATKTLDAELGYEKVFEMAPKGFMRSDGEYPFVGMDESYTIQIMVKYLKAQSMTEEENSFRQNEDDRYDAFDLDITKGLEIVTYSSLTGDNVLTLANRFCESFDDNDPLQHYFVNQLHYDFRENFHRLVQFAFHNYPEYSIVAKLNGDIVGSVINFPYEAELPVAPGELADFDALMALCSKEGYSLLKGDGLKVFYSFALYADSNLCNRIKSHVTLLLSKKCADIAKHHGYNVVMTTDTNIATKTIDAELGYEMVFEMKPKTFMSADGEYPFVGMDDKYTLHQMVKYL